MFDSSVFDVPAEYMRKEIINIDDVSTNNFLIFADGKLMYVKFARNSTAPIRENERINPVIEMMRIVYLIRFEYLKLYESPKVIAQTMANPFGFGNIPGILWSKYFDSSKKKDLCATFWDNSTPNILKSIVLVASLEMYLSETIAPNKEYNTDIVVIIIMPFIIPFENSIGNSFLIAIYINTIGEV